MGKHIRHRHDAVGMTESPPFRWRSPTRRTWTYYIDYRCPKCGATTRRTGARSQDGVVCTGVRQVVRRIGGRYPVVFEVDNGASAEEGSTIE